MIRSRLLLLFALTSVSSSFAATWPSLPVSFVTKAGVTVKGGKVTGISEKGVKVMHDGGITLIATSQLPDDVRQTLGLSDSFSPEPQALPTLPDPLTVKDKAFVHPVLVAIDPDGIRFKHEAGSTKLGYELLSPELQKALGGFDPDKAAIFRKAHEEAQGQARAAVHKQKMAMLEAENKMMAEASKNPEMDRLREDPDYLTQNVNVKLSGQAQGGKSRYEPWKTDYGSYQRSDTSSYQLLCNLTTLEPNPQRVRMQAFRLSRNLETRAFEITLVEDVNVLFSRTQPKTVSALCEASNSDDNYVALGVRERSGDKYVGWTWRAIDGQGRICGVVSSQSAYDHYAKEQPLDP